MDRKLFTSIILVFVLLGTLVLDRKADSELAQPSLQARAPQNIEINRVGDIALKANRDRSKQKDIVLPVLKQIHYYRTHPLLGEPIEEAYEALMNDEKNVEECQSILLGLNETRRLYGNDQAVARISAIGGLGYLASKGRFEPIESVLKTTSKMLQDRDEPTQGEMADFTDLLTEWMKAKGADRIERDLSLITDHFSYHPKLEEAFKSALWNTMGWKTNNPEVIRQFNRVFRGEKHENT